METPNPNSTPFARQAARLSWICPLIMVVVGVFARQIGSRVIIDLVSLLLIVAGFTFGVIALFGISKHGAKGILGHALAGLFINGFLIFIFATNFMAARAKAQQHTGIQTLPVVEKNINPNKTRASVSWTAVAERSGGTAFTHHISAA